GAGTTLTMRIPLTLAIMRALVVTSGLESYAIPQANVLELVRLEGEAVRAKVEMIGDAAVYRLRGKLLPLIWMQAELPPERRSSWSGRPNAAPLANIVILQANQLTFGLVVDEVNDTQEIVVKPLGRQVRGISIFAGATLIGNGRVVLILDVPGLAVRANVEAAAGDVRASEADAPLEPALEQRESLLLVAGPDGTRMAVPLLQITRLEEFSSSSLEALGDRDVVQYLGDVLPLADMSGRWLDPARRRASVRAAVPAGLQALVYSHN